MLLVFVFIVGDSAATGLFRNRWLRRQAAAGAPAANWVSLAGPSKAGAKFPGLLVVWISHMQTNKHQQLGENEKVGERKSGGRNQLEEEKGI